MKAHWKIVLAFVLGVAVGPTCKTRDLRGYEKVLVYEDCSGNVTENRKAVKLDNRQHNQLRVHDDRGRADVPAGSANISRGPGWDFTAGSKTSR